ncbi:U2 small nuclear ribonucleoprotein B'' [Porphyridium purpureum]|uniref:U2 small nuclear ribonucleoprotein B n=1 Tax=Porphyridium purpureum TaxID=35688 RepID=A0A5J4YPV4_PORPP|nr:U2 small nuclear ribonucleoprotein B'' [Porphyridium purpureum]|eukprot:POR9868..scf222_8
MAAQASEQAGGTENAAPRPNQTLYIKNLDDHIPKQKLRELLYVAGSQYGRVMDVFVSRSQKMRGQAFVSFEDVASAAAARLNLNGSAFLGKPLVVQFGKHASERVMRIDGTLGISKAKSKQQQQQRQQQNTKKQILPKAQEAAVPPARLLFVSVRGGDRGDVSEQELDEKLAPFAGRISQTLSEKVRLTLGEVACWIAQFESDHDASRALEALNVLQMGDKFVEFGHYEPF